MVERDLADGDLLVKIAHGLLVLLPETALVHHLLDAPEGDVRHNVAIVGLHAGLLQRRGSISRTIFSKGPNSSKPNHSTLGS